MSGTLSEEHGLTYDEMIAAFQEIRSGHSTSFEDPIDTGLWPSSDLTGEEANDLVIAIRQAQTDRQLGL